MKPRTSVQQWLEADREKPWKSLGVWLDGLNVDQVDGRKDRKDVDFHNRLVAASLEKLKSPQ